MFKSLVQPHLDYCSQLWSPQEGPQMEKIEKSIEGFHKKNSRIPGAELLAKAWENPTELRTKKDGEVQNNLHLENHEWSGAKLWDWMVRSWWKKGTSVPNSKIDGQQQSSKTETSKLPNEWSQIMERSAQKCKELENKQSGWIQRSPGSILVQSSRWAKVWWFEPRGNEYNYWAPIQLHHPPIGKKDRGVDGEQPGAGSNHRPFLKSFVKKCNVIRCFWVWTKFWPLLPKFVT